MPVSGRMHLSMPKMQLRSDTSSMIINLNSLSEFGTTDKSLFSHCVENVNLGTFNQNKSFVNKTG